MRELTVISGKGGTGKTTITASLAALADNCIAVDCDVDAPNYHLLQKVQRLHQESVVLGQVPVIDSHQCSQCGLCGSTCRFHGIDPGPPLRVDPYFCEGCGLCKEICPVGAITMVHDVRGLVITSRISTGILYHAELPPGGENSGKLVSIFRNRAREAGRTSDTQMIIADGPPGLG